MKLLASMEYTEASLILFCVGFRDMVQVLPINIGESYNHKKIGGNGNG